MAIRPAPMGQCTKKTRCLHGPNKGFAYDANQPCEEGYTFVKELCDCRVLTCGEPCSHPQTVTLVSHLSLQTKGASVTTYLPVPADFNAGAAVRVYEGNVEIYNLCTSQFETLAPMPYAEGDIYDGERITFAYGRATLPLCSDLVEPEPEPEPEPSPEERGIKVTVAPAGFNNNYWHFELVEGSPPVMGPHILHPFNAGPLYFSFFDPSNDGVRMNFYLEQVGVPEQGDVRFIQVEYEGTFGVDAVVKVDWERGGLTRGDKLYYAARPDDEVFHGFGYIEII